MFRRPVIARRRGSPLLGTALVGGAAYVAGKGAQRSNTREQAQEQRLAQLEQQGTGAPQQGYQTPPSQAAPQQGYQTPPPTSQAAPQQMYQPSPQPQPQLQPQLQTNQQTAPPEEPSPQATSATEPAPDKLAQLKTLGELRVSGVLTDAEFEAEKQRILRP